MKCLSVRQPWAGFDVVGIKPVENRTRYTHYRGPLLIHAGIIYDKVGGSNVRARFPKVSLPLNHGPLEFHLGAIIGQVNLIDCVQNHPSPWAEPGAWHWILEGAKAFDTPIPYPGRLGLFDAPDPDADHLFKPHDGRTRRVCITEEPPDIMITRPGKWGNPWRVKKISHSTLWVAVNEEGRAFRRSGGFRTKKEALQYAVENFELDRFKYKEWASKKAIGYYEWFLKRTPNLIDALPELKGLRLGCFCRPGEPCHGDVLVKMVEEMEC